jgi:mono/diheme cytochrome c family protein
MKRNTILSAVMVLFAAAIMISFIAPEDPKPWEVPAKEKNMKNPEAANAESVKVGRMLYNKNCASCHGKTGLGDGTKARGLDTFPGDFSGDYYQSQTDGDHFYKTKTGRSEMPKYDGKIDDEDVWHIVNFMRTFKK